MAEMEPDLVKTDVESEENAQIDTHGDEESDQKTAPEIESRAKGDFGEKGKFEDEVTLKFDDGDEFYLSASFLKMASPVFSRMLESDFREKTTRVIELKGKNPDDFLELLMVLHPAIQTRVEESIVFRVLPLAEEYEIKSAIMDCKKVLMKILSAMQHPKVLRSNGANSGSLGAAPAGVSEERRRNQVDVEKKHYESLHNCLKVLDVTLKFSYEDIEQTALTCIANFPSYMYTTEAPANFCNVHCWEQFLSLCDSGKIKILYKRLNWCDDVCNHVWSELPFSFGQVCPPGVQPAVSQQQPRGGFGRRGSRR